MSEPNDCPFDPNAQSFGGMMVQRAYGLLLNQTPAKGNIFVARSWALKPEEMPAIILFFPSEDQTSKAIGTAPPTFTSAPELVIELSMRGDDSLDLFLEIDRFRQLAINLLMTSVAFQAAPLEKVMKIESVMIPKDQQFQYHRAQVKFTLQTTEHYQPGPFPDLTLVDVKLVDPKGRAYAEVKITPQA